MIAKDEWLKALEEARTELPASDPDLLTVKELADALGYSYAHAGRIAERLVKQGKAVKRSKMIVTAVGQRRAAAYRLLKDSPAE